MARHELGEAHPAHTRQMKMGSLKHQDTHKE